MSRWTHVTGAFEFIAGPYISKKNKKGEQKVILPFPDEQFILSTPEVLEDKLSYRVYLL